MSPTPDSVANLRAHERYVLRVPLLAEMGPTEIEIIDISESGFQVRHYEGIKLATSGRLAFSIPGTQHRFAVRGRVVWSHLSTKPDDSGRHPYASGVRLDGDQESTAREAIDVLRARGMAELETDSMRLKRERMVSKQRTRRIQQSSVKQFQGSEISTDQLLMINHARDRLKTHPDEARKWYQRARFAMAEDESRAREAPHHYREDVLAVWEYLERTVELSTIVKVFEKQLR